jgi:hypothetical protein
LLKHWRSFYLVDQVEQAARGVPPMQAASRLLLLQPKKGWSMAEDATLSRRVVMTTRSCVEIVPGAAKFSAKEELSVRRRRQGGSCHAVTGGGSVHPNPGLSGFFGTAA